MLERVNSPRDLRKMSNKELNKLASEIRDFIVNTVAQTGGHLAPNLGVVELTIALHRVFNSPVDKIIWDVGHQSYVHKLLTGRRGEIFSLRTLDGISGFPRRQESEHDIFGTGHSSTSISAALGLAVARDLEGEDYSVVAVIGDGAMTGGMAFEALNNTGHLKKNLIVVLNDNEMSISKNVGAMSAYLSRIRTDPMYYKGKDEVESLLRKIPAVGSTVLKAVERLKDSVKYLVVPGMLFEELGFVYLGPIDGHNIEWMSKVFNRAKSMKGPILIHVVTRKGKGYEPAEQNPDKFHGIGSFNVTSGKPVKKNSVPSYTEIFGRTMVELAREDSRIVAITAAMSDGTGLVPFSREFPERFFDVGIAEEHAVTMSAGMAAGGYRPVVAIYSTFLQRGYDQIIHDVCLQNLPVTFCLDRAGIVGEDGATHHGLFDLAYLRSIPNMVVMAPKDENELRHMLKTAIGYPGPCAVRYPRGAGTGCKLDKEICNFKIGRAEVIEEGSDLAVFAIGRMVPAAVEMAEILKKKGIKPAIINARFVKPLDEEVIIKYASRTGNVLTLEENVLQGGFGSAVLEVLTAKNLFEVKVRRVGIPDTFVEHGNPNALRAKYGLDALSLAKYAMNEFWGKSSPKNSRLVYSSHQSAKFTPKEN